MKGRQNSIEFLGWHTEQCKFYKQNVLTYIFEAELISYCISDVKLLKEGFMECRPLIQSVCIGIDPFEVACTPASARNFIYRQLFMPKDSFAILPHNGYTGVELTSFPAAVWLFWIEQTARDRISEKWGGRNRDTSLHIRGQSERRKRKRTNAGLIQSLRTSNL